MAVVSCKELDIGTHPTSVTGVGYFLLMPMCCCKFQLEISIANQPNQPTRSSISTKTHPRLHIKKSYPELNPEFWAPEHCRRTASCWSVQAMLSLGRAISAANPTWAVIPVAKIGTAKSDQEFLCAKIAILLGAMKPRIVGTKLPTRIAGGRFHL